MKLFYDHLVDKSTFLNLVSSKSKSKKEQKKLEEKLDEIVHHAVLDVILFHLDEKHHEEFLALLHKTPHSEELSVYIKEKGAPEIEKKIHEEVERLLQEITAEL